MVIQKATNKRFDCEKNRDYCWPYPLCEGLSILLEFQLSQKEKKTCKALFVFILMSKSKKCLDDDDDDDIWRLQAEKCRHLHSSLCNE